MQYQNYQLFCECSMVALWNAARYFNLSVPIVGSRLYIKICKEAGCIHGGCISREPERERLKITINPGSWSYEWISKNIPVHLALFTHRGYHSVLVVAENNSRLLLANYARGRTHWMRWGTILEKRNQHAIPYSYKLEL